MDLLGDLELRPTGDRDLFEACDPSLSLRGTDLSRDLDLLLLGERDLLGDRLLDRPLFIFASSIKRNRFPCNSVSSSLSSAVSMYRRSVNSTSPSPLRSL